MNIFNNLKKAFLVFFGILMFLHISGCNSLKYKKTDTRDVPVNAKERARKNIAEGRGFSIGNIGKGRGSGTFEFASSNPLWQASLDILDFTPLSNVDYSGGIIITDWFNSEDENNNELKISVKFMSNEIRADGLEVTIFEKTCNDGNCKTRKIENNASYEIKATILKKAALISKGKKNKNYNEYIKKNQTRPINK
tara:strand:- start:282 stop:866 length:585 start_codon:yes stop_codon:yes gene_type:complete